jgi:hypothetical protein
MKTKKQNKCDMKEEMSAIKFYKKIEKNAKDFRLVNGLFIVKYINEEISVYVGQFYKANSVLNYTKTNRVEVWYGDKFLFNKKQNKATNCMGYWKPLGINFREQPIKEILK